jgi:7-cyano-7-deazaguanine synthase in queuosine biosynthesis
MEVHRAVQFCKDNKVDYHVQYFTMLSSDNRGEVFARNLLFCSKALELACHNGHESIMIGSCADDVYTDSSISFIDYFNRICELFGKSLRAPIKHLTKTQILKRSLVVGVDFKYVYSCRASYLCFKCKTCEQLLDSFEELGYNREHSKQIILNQAVTNKP